MGKSKICESQIVTTKEQKYPKHSAICIHPSMIHILMYWLFVGKLTHLKMEEENFFLTESGSSRFSGKQYR